MKALFVITLAVALLWLGRHAVADVLRRARGEPPPPQPAVRPISVIAVALLAGYGLYWLWYLFTRI